MNSNLNLQANGSVSEISVAAQQIASARESASHAGVDEALSARLRELEAALAAAEVWANACAQCEVAVQKGKEALAADSRDEAAGFCRTARGLIDGGLKSEALRAAVQQLEQELGAGHSWK
jgi:hypothetical protein